jgi:hypothetical protein
MFKGALETHLSVDRTTQEHPCHDTAKEVFLSHSAGRNPLEPPSGAAFRSRHYYFYFIVRETFQNWPGSKPITTCRFTCKWQDETRGVTQLVNGAWSSVSQR